MDFFSLLCLVAIKVKEHLHLELEYLDFTPLTRLIYLTPQMKLNRGGYLLPLLRKG